MSDALVLPLQLHHVGQAVPQLAPAAERMVRAFGHELVTPILHDPLQTAFVQFLRLRGDTSYLELVAPDSAASKLTQVSRRGGSLHHLCYMAGTLELEIARLESTGLRLISEPKPAVAFAGRRICWLLSIDQVPIELVERDHRGDLCFPGESNRDPLTLSLLDIRRRQTSTRL